MSTPDRQKLIEISYKEGQRTGNLNVLYTNAIAQKIGLSATEFECYSLLRAEGPMTAGHLARRCGITTGGLTGLVDRLEKLGFAERLADPNDRRKVLVRARQPKQAAKKLQELAVPFMAQLDALHATYSDQQMAFLNDHYRTFNDILEKLTNDLGSSK